MVNVFITTMFVVLTVIGGVIVISIALRSVE